MQEVILLESYGIPWKTKYQLRLGSRNVFRKFSFESANTSAFSWPKYWMINPRQKHGRRKGGLGGLGNSCILKILPNKVCFLSFEW